MNYKIKDNTNCIYIQASPLYKGFINRMGPEKSAKRKVFVEDMANEVLNNTFGTTEVKGVKNAIRELKKSAVDTPSREKALTLLNDLRFVAPVI
jgi:hypothetical protein